MDLLNKIKSQKITCGVIGLGYVGLPLAVEFAEAGLSVIGFDIDKKKMDLANKGFSYIKDVKSSDLKKCIKAKNIRILENAERLLVNV